MKSIAMVAAIAVSSTAALKTSSSGGMQVVNKCNYEIPLKAVPAMGVGIENPEISSTTLSANGGTWSTPWIQLLVSGGWSIKLNTIGSWTNIMQAEYTWATDGVGPIWYDNSFVDGVESEHPKWEFLCPLCPEKPHAGAYQHSTDDANGMQKPCGTDATVTLVLCPENGSSGGSSPAPSSSAAPSSSSTTPAPPPPTTTPSTTAAAPSTTFATSTSSSSLPIKQANVPDAPAPDDEPEAPGSPVIVTAYETKIVTSVVYETEVAGSKKKRHAHRHPHGHA
ncbi:hypothetical protein BDZ85DRAFT_266123 [Elsinoe ampelina]|uniref:Uncharacterized protein n=1 Tax=Elsinoe ampelina TaxID=302913 RepID=A0A6A6G5E1_9PEZI|nr:hypothetical protein BDZ85DRAFT_266123 [Elsinoe ampelina]